MEKRFLYFIFLILTQIGFSQNNLLWKGYFSYNEIKDVSESSTTIFAASENALFSKHINTGQLKTTNTIDGLSGETISALYYSSSTNKTLIGYENGLMIVINESDNSVLNVVDIINKQIPASIKKINHFMEYNGIVYVSCDFGIVQYNLKKLQFGDTYFIGNNGAEIVVTQTTIFNGFIYASTNDGIRSADVTNKNLIDFNQWALITPGTWSNIETFETELLAINSSGYIYRYNLGSNSFIAYLPLSQPSLDMRSNDNYLIITTANSVYVYDKLMVLVRQINSSQIPENTSEFTCATSIGDIIYIGTKESGLINTTISSISFFEKETPAGPFRNNVFALKTSSTSLLAVYGDFDDKYNPFPLDSYGIGKYSDKGWLDIPYEKVLDAKTLCSIAVNPNNENEVYVGSFYSGLLKVVGDVPEVIYNNTNSGLESLIDKGNPNAVDIRVNTPVFDKSGNIWMTNSRIKNPLKVFRTNGQWQSYSLSSVLGNIENVSFARMAIDKNGTKWLPNNRDGVVGFNEISNKITKIGYGIDKGNLPTYDARVVAVDNANQLWIGTINGLRVLSNVDSFQTSNQLTTNSIIIIENDLAQELMYEQSITDIVVDGANNKWIGTDDSGVFLVSPNGQQTKYHFTKTNSPLPSNIINDIEINNITGEVFIATPKGLVSFKGIATGARADLNNVFVYPNPVRPEYEGTVKVSGLLDKANIKITDIEGNLVYETTSVGGTIEWDTSAFGKYKVASGVYMIFISAQDGGETKVKKVMIIR